MKDIRAKISLPVSSNLLKDDTSGQPIPILLPITKLGGLVFPYSPNIQIQHSADYGEYDLAHVNYGSHYFQRGRPPEISIDGMFTAQTDAEARYMLAAIHFLRVVTKMRTGLNDPKRGAPPPVLKFSAYGDLLFKNVPVIIRSFSHNFANDIDYVDVFSSASLTEGTDNFVNKLPSVMTIFVSMAIQPTPSKLRTEFSMGKFKTGALVKEGYV